MKPLRERIPADQPRPTAIKFAILLFLITVLPLQAAKWETLENCRLVRDEYFDGDSFRISHKGKEMIVRLYYVDCPETDNSYPDRVKTQAEHFGKTLEETLHIGSYAKETTAQVLSRRFIVVTQYEDAMGRSSIPRYYAFVTTADGEDLAELLIKNGLARAYGRRADPPGRAVPRYDVLEGRAKRSKVGIYSPEPLKAIARAEPGPTPSPLDRFLASRATPAPTPATSSTQPVPDGLFAGFERDLGIQTDAAEPESAETIPISTSDAAPRESSNSPKQHRKIWTGEEEQALRDAVKAGKSIDEIAASHERTPSAIVARIRKLGLRSPDQTTL